MEKVMLCFMLAALVEGVVAPDWYFFNYKERQKPFYIFTMPEIVHPGELFNVGVKMSKRLSDAIIYIKLVTWHDKRVLATAEKALPIKNPVTDKPFLMHLRVPRYSEEGLAVLFIKLLQYPYIEERRVVRVERRKPGVFIKTNKDFYQLGEDVKLWVLALDRYARPYKGKIQSLMMVDADNYLVDYSSEHALTEGFANFSLSTKNAMESGIHEIKCKISNQETKTVIYVGNSQEEAEKSLKKVSRSKNNKTRRNAMRLNSADRNYSKSSNTVRIMIPKANLEPGAKAEAIIIYKNPKNGLNEFDYEIICNGQIHLHKQEIDLYSTMYCGEGKYRLWNTFRTGPSRNELCQNGETRFSIFFNIKKEMHPHCSFLIYHVRENGQIIAAVKPFSVPIKPKGMLNLVPNRKIVHTDEQLSLEISNAGDGTLLLAGDATEMEKRNSFALINNKNLRNYQIGGIAMDGERSLNSCHERNQDETAACFFWTCKVKVISNLNIEPDFRYYGAKTIGFNAMTTDDSVETVATKRQSWIWETISIRNHNGNLITKVKAPPRSGKYYIDAFFVSEKTGLSLSNRVHVNVIDKDKKEQGEFKNASLLPYESLNKEHAVTVKILPDFDERLFIYGNRCQPLKMYICTSVSKAKGDIVQLIVNMVRNFQFDKRDLKRVYRKGKLMFYIHMFGKTMLYIKRPTLRNDCFHVKLNQFGEYSERFNSGQIAYSSVQKTEKRTIKYWITKRDCGEY